MEIWISNPGRITQGSVFDMPKWRLEKLLHDNLDKQLYIKWNPDKKQGRGVWEVRRRPNHKTAVYRGNMPDGKPVFELMYVENSFTNHILDVDVLHPNLLGKLKSIDTWEHKDWDKHITEEADRIRTKEEINNRKELSYALQHERRHLKVLHDAAIGGYHPVSFFAQNTKRKP